MAKFTIHYDIPGYGTRAKQIVEAKSSGEAKAIFLASNPGVKIAQVT